MGSRGENPPNTPGVDYPRFTPSYHWGDSESALSSWTFTPPHDWGDSGSGQIPGRDSHAGIRGDSHPTSRWVRNDV